MKGWKVVYVDEHGTHHDSPEIDFTGGPAEIDMWIRSDHCKGKLLSFVTAPVRECLTSVDNQVPTLVLDHFQQMTANLAALQALDQCTEAVTDMAVYFKQKPTVQIDVEAYVKKTCDFDVTKISFRREAKKCVIVNSDFTREVYDIFKRTFETVGNELKTLIMADLTATLDAFSETASREKQNADAIYGRNKKMLEDRLANEGTRQASKHCKRRKRCKYSRFV